MPPESGKSNLAGKWLRSARADLAIARVELPEEGMYEQLCFHAQQAVEKSIKAFLLHLGIDFPLTHNIGTLVSLLPPNIQSIPAFQESVVLTPYSVLTRYPGEVEPVTEDKYAEAVRTATAVVELVSSHVVDNP